MQHMRRLLYLTQPTKCMSNAIRVYRTMHKAALYSHTCHSGADWSIFNTAGTWPRRARACLYGSNDMATGRPSLMSMACGLLMYPVYVAQVQQDSVHPYTHVPPDMVVGLSEHFCQGARCFNDCSTPKASSCLPALCTKHERLPAYVATLISSCQTCYKKN